MEKDSRSICVNVGFYLVPDFSMISLAAVIEPMRMANRLSGKKLYKWFIYGKNEVVYASNGLCFNRDRLIDDTKDLDRLFAVAGIGANDNVSLDELNWLKKLNRRGVRLGATSTGTLLLARAGILKNKRCTIHWENQDSLQEEFSDLTVTGELYEIDRDVVTCSGGLAGLDMMLQLIAIQHGENLAKDVAEQCIHPNIRSGHEKQRMNLLRRHNSQHPRFLKAIEIMRENTEEVLSCKQISELVGISSRQMERLFKTFLDESPASHYTWIRLEKAHHLLIQSTLSILQISTACGFSSSSYFARCYRNQYGCSPNEERSR